MCKSRDIILLTKIHIVNAMASLVPQTVKNLPAVQEIWVRSLGQEHLLEKGMATHFSILAWRIQCTEKPGGLQSGAGRGLKESDMTERLTLSLSLLLLLGGKKTHRILAKLICFA